MKLGQLVAYNITVFEIFTKSGVQIFPVKRDGLVK